MFNEICSYCPFPLNSFKDHVTFRITSVSLSAHFYFAFRQQIRARFNFISFSLPSSLTCGSYSPHFPFPQKLNQFYLWRAFILCADASYAQMQRKRSAHEVWSECSEYEFNQLICWLKVRERDVIATHEGYYEQGCYMHVHSWHKSLCRSHGPCNDSSSVRIPQLDSNTW